MLESRPLPEALPPAHVDVEQVLADAPVFDAQLAEARPEGSEGLERKIGIGLVLQAISGGRKDPLKLGRFEIESRIGGGAIGTVYRAFDPQLERSVAVKVLNASARKGHPTSMVSEARALARLAHPNVVTIHDIGESAGQTYVTMELVEGMNLREWASGAVPRSWREILVAYLGAARGLAAAHGCGVIHQDFKPENVMIGLDGRVRVADFGFAQRLDPSDHSEVGDGLVRGTPTYMAPELKHGAPATIASDQYAFCVALREALVDNTVCERDGALAGVFDAIERGCAEDPRERHPDMGRVIDALDDGLVVPIAGDYREVLLTRLASTFATAHAPCTLVASRVTPLSLVDAPEYSAEGLTCLPRTRALTENLHEVFDRSGGSLLVLGGPGAGKSTALNQLGQRLLERARRDPRESLPLLINLASLGDFDGPVESWLAREAFARYGLPEVETLNRLRAEAWVLLLDGLDEIAEGSREAAIAKLNELRRKYPVPTVVGCRVADYARASGRLDCRGAVRIAPLDHAQRVQVLEGLGAEGKELAERLRARTECSEQLDSPLLLTLAALGHSESARDCDEPELRSKLYDDYVGKLLSREASDEDQAELEAGVRWLARSMRERGLTEFWVERLQTDWLACRVKGAAAKALGLLMLLCLGLCLTGLVAVATDRAAKLPILLSLGAVPVAVILHRGLEIRPIDELRWSWRRSVSWIPRAVAAGAFLGGLYGLVDVLWFNFGVGIISGLIVSIPMGLESSPEIISVRPNRSIRRSALNAIGIGSVTGLVSGVLAGGVFVWFCMPYLPPESPMRQLEDPYLAGISMTATAVFLVSSMAGGGMAVVMHAALRVMLALTTPGPLRLVPFLEGLVDRGVLRRVGGGYVFPHRTLLRHLSAEHGDTQREGRRAQATHAAHLVAATSIASGVR